MPDQSTTDTEPPTTLQIPPFVARAPRRSDAYVEDIVQGRIKASVTEPDPQELSTDPDSPEQRDISRAVNEAVLQEVAATVTHVVNPEADDARGEKLLEAARRKREQSRPRKLSELDESAAE